MTFKDFSNTPEYMKTETQMNNKYFLVFLDSNVYTLYYIRPYEKISSINVYPSLTIHMTRVYLMDPCPTLHM